MEEMMKMLGPWPILQFMFGVAILGGGVYMIIRGTQKKDTPPQITDDRDRWAAYEHLRNIEENSFKMVEHLRLLREDIQRLGSIIWNRDRLGPP